MCAALAAAGVGFTLAEDLPFPGEGGVSVVAAGAVDLGQAEFDSELDRWTVDVPASVCAVPGAVSVVWTHDDAGVAETAIDVRAGNPFPFALLRKQIARGSNEVPALEQRLALQDALAEFEGECRCAMVPQRTTERLDGRGRSWLLGQSRPLRVVTPPAGLSVNDCRLVDGGVIELARAVTDATVTYEHGEPGPVLAPDVAQAVALLAASRLADGPWDDRGYGVTENGGVIRLMTAGMAGARFSLPPVQAAYMRHRMPTVG